MFDSIKNRFQLRFKNRESAASILVGALEDSFKKLKIDKKQDELLVLGIPRGGVVVADIVYSKLKSSSFRSEFDIIIPRKLGAPGNQEIAIGAIMMEEEDETSYLNEDLIKELDVSKEQIEKEKAIQIKEIKRRKTLYRNSKSDYDIDNKIVILVDDGAATGATLIAAARWTRNHRNPKKLMIAIPISSKDTIEILKKECSIVVTGTTASSTSAFKSVAQFYQEFKQVDDEKVIEICKRNKLV
jgi:putative phosphoribosyl transferase